MVLAFLFPGRKSEAGNKATEFRRTAPRTQYSQAASSYNQQGHARLPQLDRGFTPAFLSLQGHNTLAAIRLYRRIDLCLQE